MTATTDTSTRETSWMPRVDWKVDMGTLLSIVTMLAAVAASWFGQDARLQVLEMRYQSVERQLHDQAEVNKELRTLLQDLKVEMVDLRARRATR